MQATRLGDFEVHRVVRTGQSVLVDDDYASEDGL